MPTSSITKNFIVSGKTQVESFANAIEESYLESLSRQDSAPLVKYREIRDYNELSKLMTRWKLAHKE